MDVTLAVLADYSNVSKEGKLNILGIFNMIHSRTFPFVHRDMQLVMTFEAPPSEAGLPHDVKVRLLNPDGVQILEVGSTIVLSGGRPGEMMVTKNILNINNIIFPSAGDYSFHILIDNRDSKTIPFKVIQLT